MLCFTQPASGSGGCGCPSHPWRHVPASWGAEVSRSLTPCHADWDLLAEPHIYWFGWCRWAAATWGVRCQSSIGTDLTPNLPPPDPTDPRVESASTPPCASLLPGAFLLGSIPNFLRYSLRPRSPSRTPRARRQDRSLLSPFAHLEPGSVSSLSLAFISQNPPTFLTCSSSLVFPARAQLPRAEPAGRVPSRTPLPVQLPWVPLPARGRSVSPAAFLLLRCGGCISPPSP